MILPWYGKLFVPLLISATLFCQCYYAQMVWSASSKGWRKLLLGEVSHASALLLLIYLAETKGMYVLCLCVLPYFWWHLWQVIHNLQEIFYGEITYATYKEAWNALGMPVAIADEAEEILLMNKAMYTFLNENVHRKVRDMGHLWASLTASESKDLSVRRKAGRIYLTGASGDCYEAKLSCFVYHEKRYSYVLLSVCDKVGCETELTKARRRDVAQLWQSVEDGIRPLVARKIHGTVHDYMGQHLATIERLLKGAEMVDYSLLRQLLTTMGQNMRESTRISAQQQVRDIIDSLMLLGVRVKLTGSLPEQEEVAQCFVQLLREGATNAVRHGGATEVEATFVSDLDYSALYLSNNGVVPKEITLGQGLRAVQKGIEEVGGMFTIIKGERFILKGEVGSKAYENFVSR